VIQNETVGGSPSADMQSAYRRYDANHPLS
jgi:hypothetical protein